MVINEIIGYLVMVESGCKMAKWVWGHVSTPSEDIVITRYEIKDCFINGKNQLCVTIKNVSNNKIFIKSIKMCFEYICSIGIDSLTMVECIDPSEEKIIEFESMLDVRNAFVNFWINGNVDLRHGIDLSKAGLWIKIETTDHNYKYPLDDFIREHLKNILLS